MGAEDPRIGRVLHGRYRLLEHLTAGSMGVVYRAERVKLGRPVAVKILHESYASTEDGVRRFEVEAHAMSRMAHPNCVAVIDFGVESDAPYLVMDLVTGRTLREVIRAEGKLTPQRALNIVQQMLAGLSHAHGQQIIHRDVKPENIIVAMIEGQGEQVRILDFGLAKLRDQASVTTGVALGTPGYMSPEQTIGRKVDNRADIYAVGIMLYELLVGRKPFQSDDTFEVMRLHREQTPPPLTHFAPDGNFSAQLEAVVQRALAKAPEARFPSAEEMALALAETPEAHGRGAKQLSRWLIPGGIAAALAGVALVVSLGGNPKETPAPGGREPTAAPAAARGPGSSAAAQTLTHAANRPTGTGDSAAPSAGAQPAPSPAPVPTTPQSGTDVAELLAAAAAGDREAALRGLDDLRLRAPRRADVYYALGTIYIEQQDWQAAVSSYGAAIALVADYGADERVIGDLVEALADEASHERAAQLLTDQIGSPALPRLEEATRSANSVLRARAEDVRNAIASHTVVSP